MGSFFSLFSLYTVPYLNFGQDFRLNDGKSVGVTPRDQLSVYVIIHQFHRIARAIFGTQKRELSRVML